MGRFVAPRRAPRRRGLLALLLCLCACVASTHAFVLNVTPQNEAAVLRAVGLYDAARRAADRGNRELAVHLYEDAIDAYALLATAYNNAALLVYDMTRDLDHAFALLERGADAAATLGDNATLAATHNNMGYLVRMQHEQSVQYALQAIAHYDRALQAAPEFVDALYNKAAALTSLRQLADAEALLLRVLAIEPHHMSAHMDMGAIYFARGDIDKAVEHEDAIIAHAPVGRDKLGALHNKGLFLKAGDRLLQALATHEEALALAPRDPVALNDVVVARRTLCLWEQRDELIDRMLHAVDTQLKANAASSTALLPYDATLLDLSDAARKRLAIAHARAHTQSATLELLPRRSVLDTTSQQHRPLRVGYATYDFRDHPMGHLTLGLLDAHDADRVEIYCYSYGIHDGSEWRHRAEQRCDVFRDGSRLSDLEFAQQIARDQVDILVDLMAHTTGARLGLTSLRPSRVVVNYLGYPGTMGASFTDFMLADRLVVPPERAASSMTEQLVYLPHAYQVNEYDLAIPSCGGDGAQCRRAIRHAEGLAEDSIVFCNLNTIDKMEPVSFGVWMNVLRRVPGSILWLLQPSRAHRDRIEATLRDEAQSRGVDPSRIRFATRQPKRHHLARISAADLFLDSFVYNAHSTAADALWANVPIVSLWGDTFPSRVAASLIRNVLGELALVPHSIKEYEDLVVQLAEQPELLRRLRVELGRHVLVAPLFDTQRTTRHIELAYEAMHDLTHRASSSPRRFQLMIAPSSSDELTSAADVDRSIRQAIATGIACQARSAFAHALAVYERVLRTAPHHADAMHLLGLTLYQQGKLEQAAGQLTRVVEMYSAVPLFWYNRAVVLVALDRKDEAEHALREALTLDGSYADAFFKLTDMLHDVSAFGKMVEVYDRFGKAVLSADTTTETERERGYLQWSFALARAARVQDAIAVLESAIKAHPTFFRLALNLAAIFSSQGDHHASDELQVRTVQAQARHEYTTRGHKFAKLTRPSDGRRVVVLYCHEYGQSWWPSWGPSSLRTGLGGSEEAVVFMSRELRRLGFWVEVYGDPPPADIADATAATATQDGVLWYPHYTYDLDDHGVDIFIAWRYHISLAVGRHSKNRFFWVHDVPSEDAMQSRLLEDLVDGILCVSKFQASLFPRRLGPKLIVTSNALDPEYFVREEVAAVASHERSRRFVYGSSPSRGLFELLQAWPLIRARVPDATLKVFYGFTPAFMAWGRGHIHEFEDWKQTMDELLQQPGVEYVGLVDHATLAHAYADAGFYLYPTQFSETSCVSLMKAMANGAIPITSRFPLSALSETSGSFDLGPSVDASAFESTAWLDAWTESVIHAVAHESDVNHLRQRMVQFARTKYQWARVAAEWQALFFNTSCAV